MAAIQDYCENGFHFSLEENFYVSGKWFNFNNLLSLLKSGIEIAAFIQLKN